MNKSKGQSQNKLPDSTTENDVILRNREKDFEVTFVMIISHNCCSLTFCSKDKLLRNMLMKVISLTVFPKHYHCYLLLLYKLECFKGISTSEKNRITTS